MRRDREAARTYRWTILAVGVVSTAALSAVQQGIPAVGPAVREFFDLSLPEVGLVLASVNWGIVCTLLAWGALADRIGERIVISVGLAGASGAMVAASQAPSLGWLVVALAAAGASGASAASASGRAVMGWFGRSERGMALGIRQMAVPLGGAMAALTLPALMAAGGLRAALLALAVFCGLGAAAAARWLREPPPALPSRMRHDRPPPLRDRRLWRLSLGSAALICAQVTILSFVALFLHDHRGLSPSLAAACLAAIQVGSGVGRVALGRHSDRGGVRIPMLRRQGLAMAGGLLLTATLVDAPLVALLPVLLAAGVMSTSWNGLAMTACAELAGRDRAGTALGFQGTVMRLPSTVIGVAFGALVAAFSWAVGFALVALLPLAGWWLLRPLEPDELRRLGELTAVPARLSAEAAGASP